MQFFSVQQFLLLTLACLGFAYGQDSSTTTASGSTSTTTSLSTNNGALVATDVSSPVTTTTTTTTTAGASSISSSTTTASPNDNNIVTATPSISQNQVAKGTLKPPTNRKAASKAEKQKPTKPYPKDLSTTPSGSGSGSGTQDVPPVTAVKSKSALSTNSTSNLHACGPNPNSHVVINELRVRRIDFIELYGEPGTNLDGLYVLSVYHNGTVRVAIPLDGNVIPEDGYFFLSEHNDIVNGEAPDLVVPVFGANSRRHSTILLVCNYQGLPFGEVLDVDGDCQFDSQPWDKILDSVGLANARKGECTYSPTVLDSASSRCFCHIYREPDQVGDFVSNPTSPFGRDSPLDSPGRPNVSNKKQQ